MAAYIINNIEHALTLTGKELGTSDWFEIDQARINAFADITLDPQWIHSDPERCARESPFKKPIAHGFLTLSLMSHLLQQTIVQPSLRMGVNYGFSKVRFVSPVPVDSRIRARVTLKDVTRIDNNGAQFTWSVVIERQDSDKPCVIAEWLTLAYE